MATYKVHRLTTSARAIKLLVVCIYAKMSASTAAAVNLLLIALFAALLII